jgi:tRNA 2-thiouridine synthesizing protein A
MGSENALGLFAFSQWRQTRMAGISATSLDLRGLNCPLPVLRTRKMLKSLAHGGRLIVECTDPLAVIDIPHLLRETGDTLEHQEAANGLFIFHIRRGKG